MIKVVGENLVPFVRGDTGILEHIREKLKHYYKTSFGFSMYNDLTGRVVKQISHRHRNMNILEIGTLPARLS